MAREVTIWGLWNEAVGRWGTWLDADRAVLLYPSKGRAQRDARIDEVPRPYCKGLLCPTPKHKRAARGRA